MKITLVPVLVSVAIIAPIITLNTFQWSWEWQSFYKRTITTTPLGKTTGKDFWSVVGHSSTLLSPFVANTHVQYQIKKFLHQQDYLIELTRNAQPYINYIFNQVQKRHLPAELALLPMIESNYNPFVFSVTGATGLWQLMPGTGSGFGLTINWWYDGRRDVISSTNAALEQLNYLHHFFKDWLLALAAYNAGEGTVLHAIHVNKRLGKPTDFWSLPLPAETKAYVPKLLALANVIKNHGAYGMQLVPVNTQVSFKLVTIHTSMSFEEIAQLANMDGSLVRKLNPAYRRAGTKPNANDQLLLPSDKADLFVANIAKVKPVTPAVAAQSPTPTVASGISSSKQVAAITEDHIPGPQRVEYVVQEHDTLKSIGQAFHVSPQDIYFWNNFKEDTKLHSKTKLILWVSHHHSNAQSSVKKHSHSHTHHVKIHTHHHTA